MKKIARVQCYKARKKVRKYIEYLKTRGIVTTTDILSFLYSLEIDLTL